MTFRGVQALMLCVATVMLASLAFAVPATSQEASAVDVGTGGMSLLSRTIQTTDSFQLGVQLPGIVEDDDVLSIAVHERVENRAQFRAALDGGGLDRLSTKLNRIFAVAELNPTIRGSVVFDIDRLSITENLAEPGVYPVSIELRTASQEPLGRLVTHLVRIVDEPPDPTTVALALILDVVPSTSAGQIADGDPTAQWIDLLVSQPDLPVTVQPTPWLFDEFRNDPRMLRLVNRLGTAEVIAAPYVPLDELAVVEAGLGDRVDALFDRGIKTMADVLGSEPITTRWLTRTPPSRDEATVWHRRGVRDAVVSLDGQLIDGPAEIATDDGTLGALVAPQWFTDADPNDTVLGAHQLLAELAVIAFSNQVNTSSVMLFGTGEPFNRAFMEELLNGIEASTVIRPVSLSEAMSIPQLVTGSGQPIELDTAADQNSRLAGDLTLYLDAVANLESYRSMILNDEDTARVHDPLDERLLIALGTGATGGNRDAIARQVTDEIAAETSRVEAPPIGGVSLTAREATAPFSFRNNADYPLRVEVRFKSDKANFPEFDDGETTTIVLEPGITTREFRVQALSAGSFPLRIELFSPDGALELGAVDLTMRSTVPSGVGVALTVGAIVVLVAWWGRDLLRSRRRVAA